MKEQDIIDESRHEEAYQDPYADEDKSEVMPQLWEEETGDKPVHKRTAMSEQKMQVHKPTPREIHDAVLFKYDSLRRRKPGREIKQ